MKHRSLINLRGTSVLGAVDWYVGRDTNVANLVEVGSHLGSRGGLGHVAGIDGTPQIIYFIGVNVNGIQLWVMR